MRLLFPNDFYLSIRRDDRFWRRPWLVWRSTSPHYSLQAGLSLFAAELRLIVDFSQRSLSRRS